MLNYAKQYNILLLDSYPYSKNIATYKGMKNNKFIMFEME